MMVVSAASEKSLPLIFLTAIDGAHDAPAHFAIPRLPLAPLASATGMAPWSVQFTISAVDMTNTLFKLANELSLIVPLLLYS